MLLSLHYFNCYIYMVGEIKQSDGTTMSYILVGSLTRLKTLVYKINGAEYI